jgi:membrane fusion protein, multidrug efflux system
MAERDQSDLAGETSDLQRHKQRKTWLIRLAIAVAVIAALWLAWYLIIGRSRVTTDNAYANAEVAQVTPLVSGTAIEVAVTDTQAVKQGQVLVRLDPTNARIALAQARADLAEARRRFRQTVATGGALTAQVDARGADIARARAQLTSAEADLAKARSDLANREALVPGGAVSGEELTAARKAFAAANAAVSAARAGVAQAEAGRSAARGELSANQALVGGLSEETDPGVLAAKARVEAAQLDVDRTVIRAPIAGIVGKRQIQLGQRIAQGTPIMTIVPIDKLYVEANFKEGQLSKVRVGMPATATADLYGGSVVYHGKVAGIAGGTGASTALIPAQNATGNWIKVVQRLPVRIELDPKELAAHPLRIGLSMEVEVDLTGS